MTAGPGSKRFDPGNYVPVGDLLALHRVRDPGKPALVDLDRGVTLSFGVLAGLVDSVALQMWGRGVCKGSRVLLHIDNSIEKLVVWFALWRIGAVVCPLDLSFIRATASQVLQTIEPDLVVTDASWSGQNFLEQLSAPIIYCDEWRPDNQPAAADSTTIGFGMLPEGASIDHLTAPAAGDLACLCCTSGTSGLPKIVAYDHHAYWQNGVDSIELLALDCDDRTLEYRALGWYSAQILSVMPFLQLGLTLHLARRFSRRKLPDWIEQHRITVCVGVPAVINILLNAPVPQARQKLATLRTMTCSTAPLPLTHWRQFEEVYGVPVTNLYGSSETGWICGNRPTARRIGTVGQPVGSVHLSLAAEATTAREGSKTGRVTVTGDKLALGYLQSDGSLQAIRGQPFAMNDIATMDADGYVRILGRNDDLIMRGGVKISPVEIEEVVLAHPDLVDAGVVAMPDPVYGHRVVCLAVARLGCQPQPDQIVSHCADRLPKEKVPADVLMVDELPRNPHGKLLRRQLPDLYRSRSNGTAATPASAPDAAGS
ncbi:MAG: long-chain acyl-CoA synthetase [Burkholderiales bacterium]